MVEVWRGAVQTWECDAMGHMNIRFYVARAMEGLTGLAAALGMPDAFTARAASTLMVREHHIRFLREARADAPLYMEAGVVEMGDADALVLQVLRHSVSGEPAATLLTRVVHASPGAGQVFPWPQRIRDAAEPLKVDIPEFAAPRGIEGAPVESAASQPRAEALGIPCGARGAVMPAECDVFGRMRTEAAMARMSDGMSYLLQRLNGVVAEADPDLAGRFGGVALEYRLIYLDLPKAGAGLEVRSAGVAITPKLRRARHWLLDAVSGRPWAVSEVLAANFDLVARKVIAAPSNVLDAFAPLQRPDMPL